MSAVLLVAFWNVIWPYLVGAHVLGGRWWLWRTDRFIRAVIGSGTVQGGADPISTDKSHSLQAPRPAQFQERAPAAARFSHSNAL